MREKKGFTLIELLVSISIIAILTALLSANFIGARQRGRDGQRKSNLYQMQSALELYRSDNGLYPLSADLQNCGEGASLTSSGGAVYMQKLPCDPQTDDPYIYTSADGTSYTLYACLENEADSEISPDQGICTSPAVPFKLTNP